MWYDGALINGEEMHYDERLIRSLAVFEARKQLFLDQDPAPLDSEVYEIAEAAIERLQQQNDGELRKVRRAATTDDIRPFVEEAINAVLRDGYDEGTRENRRPQE